MLVRTWMRPSSVFHAIVPWVSIWACWTLRHRVRPLVNGVGLPRNHPRRCRPLHRFRRRYCPVASTSFVVEDRGARQHRLFGIEHGGQNFVIHLGYAAALFRGCFGLGDDGGDPLADEAHDVVEHVGVVGVDQVIVVQAVVKGRRGTSSQVKPRGHPGRRAPCPCGWP